MGEVTPRWKGDTRPWVCPKNNDTCTRTSPCPSCRGRRNRTSGLRKQRAARKALEVPPSRFHGQDGQEENWRWVLRAEVKSGKQVESLTKRFLAAEAQSDANKAIADARPFAFVAMPVGMQDGFICVRLSVWRSLIAPALSPSE